MALIFSLLTEEKLIVRYPGISLLKMQNVLELVYGDEFDKNLNSAVKTLLKNGCLK